MGTNQTEEKAGYPEWLGPLRLIEPEDEKEREAIRMDKEKTEKGGVRVRVRWDEGLEAIVVKVIKAMNFELSR